MQHQIYDYLQSVHRFIEAQERRINNLEQTVGQLQKELNTLKERPPIQVGTIEYKFDQLKVESLDGTLNIGLNPSDLPNIDEFQVKNKMQQVKNPLENRMKDMMEIEDELMRYLETDLPKIIEQTEIETGNTIDDSYLSFIKEDVKKQIPKRIELYYKQLPENERTSEQHDEVKHRILDQVKIDIQNGVFAFISNLPKTQKGDQKDELSSI